MKIHQKYMNRCIQIAKNGLGTTYPNPMVGSVIVHNDQIIGEGWHYQSGMPHAEVNAVNSVKDLSLLKDATIYVSLEPCSHYGKTPPCVDLILKHQIPNVVIGTVDPNEKVAGKSVQKLKDAGINVIVGVLEKECQELNKRFFTFHNNKRPYIILKWAQSNDSFLAPLKKDAREPIWITNELSRILVHKWRTEENGILVGKQTVLDDNPKLNSRDYFGNQPTRITFNRNNAFAKDTHFLDDSIPTLIFGENEFDSNFKQTNFLSLENSDNSIDLLLQNLYNKNIQSVIIEGGFNTLQRFIDSGNWDEARIFTGKIDLIEGIPSPTITIDPSQTTFIKDDRLQIIYNSKASFNGNH